MSQPVVPSAPRRVGPFLVIVLLLVMALGFGLTLRPEAPTPGQRIALVGDSITDQARGQLLQTFAAPDVVRIEAVPGRTIEEQLPAARSVAADRPQHVVINLGSNDVLLHVPMERSVQMIDELFGLFDTDTCVHVVNVNETFFLMFQDELSKHAKELNAVLAAEASRRGFAVVDWARIVNEYYAAGQPKGPLTADTVHPTELGKQILADAYRTSVQSCTPGRDALAAC